MRAALRWVCGALVVVACSGAVMLGQAIGDTDTVTTRADLEHVMLGKPWDWVDQDHTPYDPPLEEGPRQEGFISPMEHPTDVRLGPALADLAVFSAAFGALALLLRAGVLAVVRRRRPVAH